MTEWIEHDGNSTPDLPDATLVQVRFKHGPDSPEYKHWSVAEWGPNWIHDPDFECSADIVAYRVIASK